MLRREFVTWSAAAVLVGGLGVGSALAAGPSGNPAPTVTTTTQGALDDEQQAADDVTGAADDVQSEAENPGADDQAGDNPSADDQNEAQDAQGEDQDDQGEDQQTTTATTTGSQEDSGGHGDNGDQGGD